MKRIKTLGLAAIMALALTATAGAASASASGFLAEGSTSKLVGVPTGAHFFALPGFATLECVGPEFEAAAAPTETLTSASAGTNSPTCKMFGTVPFKMNGCQLSFHPGAQTGEGSFAGTVDIGPANCSPITIGTSSTSCEIKVGAQSGLAATFHNEGTGSKATVNIGLNGTGLQYTQNGTPGCKAGTFNEGTYFGSWQLKGLDSLGSQSGVHVASQAGIYLAGEKSEEKAKQPRLEAEKYPAGIAGSTSSVTKLKMPKFGTAECSGGQLSGARETGAVAELSLQPTLSGCKTIGQTSTVTMGSCHYLLNVANAGPPYTGSLELVCGAGGSVKITAGQPVVCTVLVPAQTIGTVTYENKGTGAGRYVVANVSSGESVKYSYSGSLCGTGSGENGIFSSSIALQGLY
jgi:hypothetical protein